MATRDVFQRPSALDVLLASSTLDDDGGLPVCLGRLGAALATAGHAVTIVGQQAGAACPAVTEAGRVAGVEVVAIDRPRTIAGQWTAAREMSTLVAGWLERRAAGRRPVVVHTHGVWTPAIIAAAETARRSFAPLVISPHGMLRTAAMRRSRRVKQLAWTACVRREIVSARGVHATSEQEADDLRRLVGPGLEVLVVPWGVDGCPGAASPSSRPRSRVAIAYGRMLPIKGFDMLLEAWAVVRPAGWRLRLAGPCDAAMRHWLDRRIAALGIADVVSIEPAFARGQLGRVLSDVSLVVVPSRSENFSLATGEALAAGLPVITTTETAWREVVARSCGWCVRPDVAEIAVALRTATDSSPESLAAMGRRGAAWIAADFGWAAIADRLVRELYLPAV